MRHGKVVAARIGLAGVADRPVRAAEAEQLLHGQRGRRRRRPAARGGCGGGGASRAAAATATFTGHVAGVLARRAVTDALRRATGAAA